jgi:L-Ala-D/L-Glu epimerase
MHISVQFDTFQLGQVFTISRGSRTEAQVLTVRIESDGHVGWGECVPYARYGETLTSVASEIEGADVRSRPELFEALPAGAARNALDCAFWDLEAKMAGVRVSDLAGLGPLKPEITAYTLSLGTPEMMEAQAAKNAFRPLLKIKLGTTDDMPRLEAVRRGAPLSRIIVDANEGWSAAVYLDLAPHLVRLGVELVEQPLPSSEDDALLGLERVLPTCADESCHDRKSLTAMQDKYDFANIKLDKTGGLTEALALKDAAQAAGFGIMVGCMVGSSLAMAPATLVAQGAAFTDLDGPLLLAEDRMEALKFDKDGVHPPVAALWG